MVKGVKFVVKNTTGGLISRWFDLISPLLCRGCGAEGEVLCECCKKYIIENLKVRGIKDGDVTRETKQMFLRTEYLGFRDEILGELTEEYKYGSVKEIGRVIAEIVVRGYLKKSLRGGLEKGLEEEEKGVPEDFKRGLEGKLKEGHEGKFGRELEGEEIILVPMPTSRRHIRQRGFDHMDLLVREIAKQARREGMNVRRVRFLERNNDSVQVGADADLRREQAREAVRLSEEFLRCENCERGTSEGLKRGGKKGFEETLRAFRGREVILIDDVWTTGASLVEAGKILRRVGLEKVSLLAIVKNRQGRSPIIGREIE